MFLQLTGFHHLTAVTANAPGNHAFYTETLGMRLVKKTVNQDDVSAYHLFYADGNATPGTDVTFFDWPVGREERGSRSIARTGLRVASEESLSWWAGRFAELGVTHGGVALRDGRTTLDFEDEEGQRLSLVVDASPAEFSPWQGSRVPREHQIRGLGPILLSVPHLEPTEQVLTNVLGMRRLREYLLPGGSDGSSAQPVMVVVFAMGAGADGGAATELHVAAEPSLPPASPGAGGVHHVAFRTPTLEAYQGWVERLKALRIPSSGPVDRFYFRSLYFREPGGILFEIATDGPGFDADEPLAHLGERLALPPFLEPRRAQIEAGLQPL